MESRIKLKIKSFRIVSACTRSRGRAKAGQRSSLSYNTSSDKLDSVKRIMFKKLPAFLIAFLGYLMLPASALALGRCPGSQVPTPLPGQYSCIELTAGGFAKAFLDVGIGLGALLATLFLIVGGIQVVASSGDPKMLEAAKQRMTSAITGLLFILMSVLILDIIGADILGIDIIK